MKWFWDLELFNSPVQPVTVAITVLLLLMVLWFARGKHGRHPRVLTMLISAAAGLLIIGGVVWLLEAQNLFDGPLPEGSYPWVLGAGAFVGVGVLGLVCKPWWNRILAVFLILGALLSLGLQVNRLYGLTNTPGLIFDVETTPKAVLPQVEHGKSKDAVTIANWKPPVDMPSKGRVGALEGNLTIPRSKPYSPRPASVYLPPAALVKHPPKLPVMVVMMGQPGSPDPTRVANALDAYAAQNQGLAPIAVVVDQLAGHRENDPICMDSQTFGAVSTYINEDTVNYIKEHFNVLESPKDWAITGYSNGGSCAWQYGTQFPEKWGAILNVSGNKFPGSAHPNAVVNQLWGGDKAAYEAWLPEAQLKRNAGKFYGHLASFTWGDDDLKYGPAARSNSAAAAKAGFTVKNHGIPGAGHVGPAATEGLSAVAQDFGDFTGLTRGQ